MKFPDLSFETSLWQDGFSVIGIDEVGRGAFAGPVGIGGVIFPPILDLEEREKMLSLGINDSKKLSPKRREKLAELIKKLSVGYCVSLIPVQTINEIGIGKATTLGMVEVAQKLSAFVLKPHLLIDAFEIPGAFSQQAIVRGDSLSISIAAASIIAKVERDRLMGELGGKYPAYGFEQHKGYGTLKHRNALREFGSCQEHRLDFISNHV